MLELPTKQQYDRWSMPSKATLKSYWLAILMALFTIFTFFYNYDSINHELKEKISISLNEFKTSLKQVDLINDDYKFEDTKLRTTDDRVQTINMLNQFHKKISSVIDFNKLYILIKDYGKSSIDNKLSKFSSELNNSRISLMTFIANIDSSKIKNQNDYNNLYTNYYSLLNKEVLAQAKYHGFISSLSLKDFKY